MFPRWWTAVHETRYESEHCLEKTKQEIAELEQRLVKLGWSREALLTKEKKKRREGGVKSGKKNEEKTEESYPATLDQENEENKGKVREKKSEI